MISQTNFREKSILDRGKKHTGKKGEDIAARYLKENGYRIIECNYRCPLGEIDIIAKDKNTIVFVEVKCRRSEKFGAPQLSVGKNKQKKLSKVCLYYLKDKRLLDQNARFDVVAVKILLSGTYIKLIKNAFEFYL
jgi:putative endonuclease